MLAQQLTAPGFTARDVLNWAASLERYSKHPLGRAIVNQLLHRVPPSTIVASVRDPAKATDLDVQVRQADFADPASVARAFEGATKVLIVSLPLPTHLAVPQHRTAIEAARAAGVSRILYTSQMGADPASAFSPMHT
ncbi:MAG: NAD(P)H-binding protein, partial [Planctomycetota bacterium]